MSGDNIGFQAASPDGRERFVLLCFRPDAEGRVATREWSGAEQGGREQTQDAADVLRRIDAWEKAGWKFTESPIRIRAWLGG
ncbi:hypothetical protein [Longimicrobium terrae]|uniref:Uncharacterized protein n=1 Tax=Longimicrobium terrae TaxID=1639882 RepID=A0A841GPF1_9BACT|nr:hypothetical protein [Longimicrobium terrae]MBB4634837.1 hypothetical protein [Longimicrobium terrae]MBB6069232.1 hypothetical protein [Longimicrobium terrae]NNC31958.1 hypothetical protein [Longimicrobium terrae]